MTGEGKGIPQLPVSCLAEYVSKGGRSPESVLRPYKFRASGEGLVRIVFRPPVVTIIRKHYKLNKDPKVFESARADWQKKADATQKKGQRARLHSNMAALDMFRSRYKDRDFEVLPIHRISCRIGEIIFTAQPDLWVRENGREHLIKIGFGKKKRSYIDALLVVMRRAALTHHHRIRPHDAVFLNVLTGEELVSRFSYRELVLSLTAAAREIAEIWPKVTQLEAPVPQLGKGTGFHAHGGTSYSEGS